MHTFHGALCNANGEAAILDFYFQGDMYTFHGTLWNANGEGGHLGPISHIYAQLYVSPHNFCLHNNIKWCTTQPHVSSLFTYFFVTIHAGCALCNSPIPPTPMIMTMMCVFKQLCRKHNQVKYTRKKKVGGTPSPSPSMNSCYCRYTF